MNFDKIRRAVELLKEALIEAEEPTVEEWAEFGRACAAAIRIGYDVDGVAKSSTPNSAWKPQAHRLYLAAKRVGFEGRQS